MKKFKTIFLITETTGQNSVGQKVSTGETKRQVFAELLSIMRNEFYQASIAGYSPKLTFKIRTQEYQGEKNLEYDNVKYRIIRDYSKDQRFTELVCEDWTI